MFSFICDCIIRAITWRDGNQKYTLERGWTFKFNPYPLCSQSLTLIKLKFLQNFSLFSPPLISSLFQQTITKNKFAESFELVLSRAHCLSEDDCDCDVMYWTKTKLFSIIWNRPEWQVSANIITGAAISCQFSRQHEKLTGAIKTRQLGNKLLKLPRMTTQTILIVYSFSSCTTQGASLKFFSQKLIVYSDYSQSWKTRENTEHIKVKIISTLARLKKLDWNKKKI